ncbi:ribonuclease H-like domain-containing protein [Oribacterium sp. oral taxon 108]|uniref:ribonuclease H-like domain-containing protein n=1 Tax=Oribacterium sp. oral taxon 108 TaxID=712414 RepID=UPI001FA7CAA0
MESCSLKSCERFLGIYREDRCNGGELISVYREYLQNKDSEKRICCSFIIERISKTFRLSSPV